jgi:alpha-beta hydrolase superfamily lysophospholipase
LEKQAIAIGLSEARRAGVKLASPKKGTVSEKTRINAKRESEKGERHEPISRTRSRAGIRALKKEPTSTVSKTALSKQAKSAAKKRTATSKSTSAKKAARTRKSQ